MPAGRAGKPATRPVEWLIAILGGLAFSAVLVWLLRGSAPVTPPPPTAPQAVVPLIGSGAEVPPFSPAPMEAPPPSLDKLKLRGIFSRPGQAAAAIIETADGQQRLYRVGSTIIPGVRLARIDPAAIIVQTTSQLRSLGFGDEPPVQVMATHDAPDSLRDRLGTTGDLATASNSYRLGMKANRSGNETRGFAIKNVSGMPIFQRAGLIQGDIVTSVNGIGLISEEKIIELPGELAGSNEVLIMFERGGKRQTVTVKIAR